MNNVPAWAEQIIVKVAREHHRRVPDVTWRTYKVHVRTAGSTITEDKKITLTSLLRQRTKIIVPGVHCSRVARRERADAKRVLCHELAHWLSGEGHTRAFWLVAFELYRRFRIPLSAALRSECEYKQGALAGYWAGRSNRGRRPINGRVNITTSVDAGPPLGNGNGYA